MVDYRAVLQRLDDALEPLPGGAAAAELLNFALATLVPGVGQPALPTRVGREWMPTTQGVAGPLEHALEVVEDARERHWLRAEALYLYDLICTTLSGDGQAVAYARAIEQMWRSVNTRLHDHGATERFGAERHQRLFLPLYETSRAVRRVLRPSWAFKGFNPFVRLHCGIAQNRWEPEPLEEEAVPQLLPGPWFMRQQLTADALWLCRRGHRPTAFIIARDRYSLEIHGEGYLLGWWPGPHYHYTQEVRLDPGRFVPLLVALARDYAGHARRFHEDQRSLGPAPLRGARAVLSELAGGLSLS